jgi:hypothetical protein
MSTVGYYRYKYDNLTEGNHTAFLLNNGTYLSEKYLVIKYWCTGQRLIKYLDKSGQYRFYPFNKYWESKDKPTLLGKTNELITDILTAQSNAKIVGYKNERSVMLIADEVTEDELTILSQIYTSPRVYLYIGTTTDIASDWLLVEVKGKDFLNKRKKGNVTSVEIECILPEWFSINML